jgi:hypothetical protein
VRAGISKLIKIKLRVFTSRSLQPPESHFTLNGRNFAFLSSVKYLGVIFDKRVTWRVHIGMIKSKAFRTFVRVYSLL